MELSLIASVAGAGKIIVLEKGRVAEMGKPQELAESGGIYSRMLALQTQGENWSL